MNPKRRLFDLLLSLFPNNDALLLAITSIDHPQIHMVVASLPNPVVSRIKFTLDTVDQLVANGLDNAALFDDLTRLFPVRRAYIESARQAYLGTGAAELGETADAKLDDVAAPITDATMAAHEKIMGSRPTFLDVAYLALGYQQARAVAKLRMHFSDGWYSGTAFLIAPDKLMTAHHNLVTPSGEVATRVTARFDYERNLDGPEAEGLTIACDVAGFAGEAGDDWALITLATAQAGRPVTRLSDVPARTDDRVAIIQHPGGMAKQVALHDNLVTFADATRVQYLTDTLPGSSGAPVFDARWRVVALHHAGGDLNVPGTKQMVYRNQGIAIGRVRERMAALGVAPG